MKYKLLPILLTLCICIPAAAQAKIIIASGAGYRSLVDNLAESYTAHTGKEIERIYGNMARVTTQARNSGEVDMVLGDKSFLDRARLDFCKVQKVGRGRLVIAFPKGSHFDSDNDLLAKTTSRIALPDATRAIYGKAAMQYLRNRKIYGKIENKLLMVATVPQSASYVVAGEVDYAFINMTHARKISGSIGGYVVADENAYTPISIIIEQMSQSAKKAECTDFMTYLRSDKALQIIKTHGMQD